MADAFGKPRAQVAAPCGAHGGGEPAEYAVFVVDGVEHLHGDAQCGGNFTFVCRTDVLVIFGGSLSFGAGGTAQAAERHGGGCHIHLEAHHAGVLGAVQRQHAVRRNGTNTVREGEIVRELRTNAFLTGNHAGLNHAAFTQALEELFAQHRVGESAVNQDRAGAVEGLFGAVNLQGFVRLCNLNALVLVLVLGAVGNVCGGNGVCLG